MRIDDVWRKAVCGMGGLECVCARKRKYRTAYRVVLY